MQTVVTRLPGRHPFRVLVGVVVISALVASWLVTFEIQSSFHSFKATVYGRCLDRGRYDAKQSAVDRSLEGYYGDLFGNIQHNSPDNAFYRRLEGRVVDVNQRLDDLLATGPPSTNGCLLYKP